MSLFDEDLTWTCMVCNDERPDARISVARSRWQDRRNGIVFEMNTRYCNDRRSCVADAFTYPSPIREAGRIVWLRKPRISNLSAPK